MGIETLSGTSSVADYFNEDPNTESSEYAEKSSSLLDTAEALRDSKGWTQKALANKAGINVGTYRNCLHNPDRNLSPANAVRLAQFLNRHALTKKRAAESDRVETSEKIDWQVRKVGMLLRMLEEELAWFRKSETRRNAMRERLSMELFGDMAAQLRMITNEDRFVRWLQNSQSSLGETLQD
jgi:transcriptional regulator with XRE-family HTH domain